MSKSLTDTAAEYFGIQREPRTSVKVRDGRVLHAMRRGSYNVLTVYDKHEFRSQGMYLALSDQQARDLIAALSEQWGLSEDPGGSHD